MEKKSQACSDQRGAVSVLKREREKKNQKASRKTKQGLEELSSSLTHIYSLSSPNHFKKQQYLFTLHNSGVHSSIAYYFLNTVSV